MELITKNIPYVSAARNAEHDYLFDKLVNAIPLAFATSQNFLPYHQKMTDALEDEHASYKQTTKQVETEQIVEKDTIRDNYFRRLKLYCQAFEFDPDVEKVEAAKRCLIAIGPSNPSVLPYTENTAAIKDIVDKLESAEYADAVNMIEAKSLIADLKKANEDFDATYSKRTDDHYMRTSSTIGMKNARKLMETAYYDVVDILNAVYIKALVLVPDEEVLAEVTQIGDSLKAQINQFSQILAHRGVGSSSNKETEEPGTEEEPETPQE